MIRSFKDKRCAAIFAEKRVRKFDVDLQRHVLRKLQQLDAVDDIEEMRIPPGNRLERLIGDRDGQYSIRVNRRWRICFIWLEGHAEAVELIDYH